MRRVRRHEQIEYMRRAVAQANTRRFLHDGDDEMGLRDNGLSSVTVRKKELLAKLRENREKHAQEAQAAKTAYYKKLETRVAELHSALKEDTSSVSSKFSAVRELIEPQSYLSDYDRVIGMLDMSVSDEIVISEEQFRHFVQDEWLWTDSFKTINASYAVAAPRR